MRVAPLVLLLMLIGGMPPAVAEVHQCVTTACVHGESEQTAEGCEEGDASNFAYAYVPSTPAGAALLNVHTTCEAGEDERVSAVSFSAVVAGHTVWLLWIGYDAETVEGCAIVAGVDDVDRWVVCPTGPPPGVPALFS